jgi:hypothetical protein
MTQPEQQYTLRPGQSHSEVSAMGRMGGESVGTGGRILACLFAVALLMFARPGHSAPDETSGSETVTSGPITIRLKRVESTVSKTIEIPRGFEVRFRKEPSYRSPKVTRGVIPMGADPKRGMGFACDGEGKQLYLDRNRDLDLTNDGEPVRWDAADSYGLPQKPFMVEFASGPVVRRYFASLTKYPWQALLYLGVSTSWMGSATVDGKPWKLAVLDNLDGDFDGADTLFFGIGESGSVTTESVRNDQYFLPRSFVVDGKAYGLSVAFSDDSPEADVVATISASTAPLVTKRLAGGKIRRLRLDRVNVDPSQQIPIPADQTGNTGFALYDHPGEFVEVPEGFLGRITVEVDGGFTHLSSPNRAIGEGARGDLRYGAPLKPTLTAVPTGNRLQLDFKVSDDWGNEYTSANTPDSPPAFAVYRGSTKVGEGKFEYG